MTTLSQIARGAGIDFDGADLPIAGINTLVDATAEQISFFDNQKYLADLKSTRAAAVILDARYAPELPEGCVALCDPEPYLKMALASKLFAPPILDADAPEPVIGEGSDIAPGVYVANGARIGERCTLMPGAFVGAFAVIGDDTVLHPNVTVYRDCVVGSRCILHANTVIGSDGYGFAHTRTGEHVKIYQNGNVVVENDVEIGSNCAIDRAVFGSTRIRHGAKLDNLIQIAHNCVIGEHTLLAAQVGLAGSSVLGRNVVMGGQSATAGHLRVAPFTTIAARGGVTKSINEPKKTFAGFPHMEHRAWLKLQGILSRLLKSQER